MKHTPRSSRAFALVVACGLSAAVATSAAASSEPPTDTGATTEPATTEVATTEPATTAPTTTHATTTAAPTTLATTTTELIVQRQPLTGVVIGGDVTYTPRPALVVKIDNVDAEPQTGLNQADIVYEEIVEGATRFAAIFNSMDSTPVGPIRSGRTQDVALLANLNQPIFAYSGANDTVNAALDASDMVILGPSGENGFFRSGDRSAPHNLYSDTPTLFLRGTAAGAGEAVPIFEYLAPGAQSAGTPVTFAELSIGGYNVRWDWDPARGFLRSQLGSAHEATDGQVTTNNVVVLVVAYGQSPAGGVPEAQTTGTGRAVVYSNGLKVEGTWTRATPADPFTLEAGGAPILLAPGRTWVELADGSNNLTDG